MATTDRVKKLEEKEAQAKKLLAEIAAQKRALLAKQAGLEKKKVRAQDTRRKILLGAYVLESMQRHETTRLDFTGRMDKYLARADDRALFGLQPRANTDQK